MHPQQDEQHTSQRQRRTERYAAEYMSEPSMSAPQPMPTATVARSTAQHKRIAANPEPEVRAQAAEQTQDAAYHAAQSPQGWSQAYAPVPQQQGWSQAYAPVPQQQGWSQAYPAAQPQQGWSQTYAPVPQQQGWSQAYPPAQPQQPVNWSQPYPVQPRQGWQGTNGYDPAAQQVAPVQMPPAEIGDAGWPRQAVPGGPGGGDGSGHGPAGGSGMWVRIGIIAAVVLLIVAAAIAIPRAVSSSKLHDAVSEYNNKFCEGVFVDGIDLGGMTQAEARNAVNANAQQRMQDWNVRLTYGGGLVRKITAGDLGMTVNVDDALEAAWQQGHASSDVAERKAAMDALLLQPYEGFTALPSGDTSVIDAILNDLAAAVYSVPQDAYISKYDPAAHSNPFEIQPEVYGYFLDVEPVKRELYALVAEMQNGSIELAPQTVAPNVTEAQLRRQLTLRGTASTVISTTSTPERTANIERAFQLINGKILKPGESFSFNNIVGARSQKNGFFEAIEYAYGNERMGYGGGVCQASTTIYLAAVRANMSITHREPHSSKVNYTAYGLDATVNYDGKKIDLTFKNTTGSDVYIMSYLFRANGRWNCRVDIYGEAHEEGVTYELVAETVEVLAPPEDPEYVEDESGTHVVYIDDVPVQKRPAENGYVVETFRVKYLNGTEVDRTFMARDTYKAKSQQLWVGVSERE